jgi:hypothetical protein
MRYEDGSMYIGMWWNSLFHGWGTFLNRANSTTYSGEWVRGVREGTGTCRYDDGTIYSGYFKGNVRNGKGVCSYANQVMRSLITFKV